MKWVKLEEIAEITGGGTPKTKVEEYWNGNIVWLSPTDLPEIGEIVAISDSTRKITKEGLDRSSAKLLPIGSVVFSSRASIGKIGISEVPLATNQGFVNFICNEEIYNWYLAYVLKFYTNDILNLSNSTTFKEVSRSAIKNFKIPLPSLSEQKAIVAKLYRAQRLIDIDREMLAKYDELIQSVFLEMFGDPVTNPKGWEIRPIKALLTTVKTTREDPKQTEKVYDYVSIADIDNETKKIVSHTPINKTNAPSRARQLIKPNDILVSTVRPNLNAVALYNNDLINPIASTGFCVLRPDLEIVNPYYLFQISQSRYFVSKLSLIANGASYPAVSEQDVLNLETPLPPLDKQYKFEEIIEKISQEYRITETNQKKSEELFSALVQEAFGVE